MCRKKWEKKSPRKVVLQLQLLQYLVVEKVRSTKLTTHVSNIECSKCQYA